MTMIKQFLPTEISDHMSEFIEMLKLAVDGGASIGWLAPLSEADAQDYWLTVQSQVATGSKILLVAQQDDRVVGAVQIALESRKNGDHRGEVQKLVVHMNYRRQGIARQLMETLDTSAKQAKRSLLVLDVRKGDPAETLYQQMGYIHVGDIPEYARNNDDGFDATAFYYKLLL